MTKNWETDLQRNIGKVWLPDGSWGEVKTPSLGIWDGDIWCDPKEAIELPNYEQNIARFIESVVAAKLCGRSGGARFNFVFQHVTDRAKGDLFDWNRVYIDREREPRFQEDEVTFCDHFTAEPHHVMKRLRARVNKPRKTLVQDRNLYRMAIFSLARKCFLARIGYPEFCERQVF